MKPLLDRLPLEEIWIVGLTEAQLTGREPFDPADKINMLDLMEYIRQYMELD